MLVIDMAQVSREWNEKERETPRRHSHGIGAARSEKGPSASASVEDEGWRMKVGG